MLQLAPPPCQMQIRQLEASRLPALYAAAHEIDLRPLLLAIVRELHPNNLTPQTVAPLQELAGLVGCEAMWQACADYCAAMRLDGLSGSDSGSGSGSGAPLMVLQYETYTWAPEGQYRKVTSDTLLAAANLQCGWLVWFACCTQPHAAQRAHA